MWIPKKYWEAKTRQIDKLERRVKRLELIMLDDASYKIASLSDGRIDRAFKDGEKPIEELAKKSWKHQSST